MFPGIILQDVKLFTYPDKMGEEEAREAGLKPIVLGEISNDTTAEDTKRAAAEMLEKDLDLLVFSGGDGTARDIYSVIGDKLPILGIPTGVKIHSGVYAVDPRSAGELLCSFIKGVNIDFKLEEVMDIDEDAFRENILQARLYGYMKTLYSEEYIQGGKESSRATDESSLIGIANELTSRMSTYNTSAPDDFELIYHQHTIYNSVVETMVKKKLIDLIY